jgi:hypothetical protein
MERIIQIYVLKIHIFKILFGILLFFLSKESSAFVLENLINCNLKSDFLTIDKVVSHKDQKKRTYFYFSGLLEVEKKEGELFGPLEYTNKEKYYLESDAHGNIKIGDKVPIWFFVNKERGSFYLRNNDETCLKAFSRLWAIKIIFCLAINIASGILIFSSLFFLFKKYF